MAVFRAPSWVPSMPENVPDSISIYDFMFDERYGRYPAASSRAPFVCGLTGKKYSTAQVKDRVEILARGLAQELEWQPNKGTEWEKAACVFTLNAIDTMTVVWAVHRLGGLVTTANATYQTAELIHQLKSAKAKTLFTCQPLLSIALEAADAAGIPKSRVYLIDLPEACLTGPKNPHMLKTVDQVIASGESLSKLEALAWTPGDGKKKVALLCFSSGTSGLPHYNVIVNVLQIHTYERSGRLPGPAHLETVLGVMPQSHIYGLVVICHATVYAGDNIITLPRYTMPWMLAAIAKFKISTLFIVPPIIIQLANNATTLAKHDLSSVKTIWTGAAPLAQEVAEKIVSQHPTWHVLQGYGLTETCTLVSSSSPNDPWLGSSGSLLPGLKTMLMSPDNQPIKDYDTPGELLIQSPSNALGYLNAVAATKETFQDDGFVRTGDEAVFRRSPGGHDHLFIIDRIKELIKVKGHQVAPAELEAHLLGHPLVSDAAVIPVPDDAAGEVPKAFVVKTKDVGTPASPETDRQLASELQKYVEEHKARYKWLKGGIEFIEVVPKSPSGKILRRLLKDNEREKRKKAAMAKL